MSKPAKFTVTPVHVVLAGDIRALRRRLKMTQPEFARLMNAHPKTVSYWEHGKRFPSQFQKSFLRAYSIHLSKPGRYNLHQIREWTQRGNIPHAVAHLLSHLTH